MRELILKEKQILGAVDNDLSFIEVKKSIADEIIKKYHYSKKVTSNSFCSLLINNGSGVMQLGYGIRPKLKGKLSTLCQNDNWCEFDRMWLSDDMPKFSESRVIGLLFFYIKHKYPNIRYVITYADELAGNKGTIYKATNFIEIEGKEVDFYLLPNGERLHPVTAWHRHKTRKFEILKNLYPGIIRIRGNNVQGDYPEEYLDKFRGKKQRKFIYALERKARRKMHELLNSNKEIKNEYSNSNPDIQKN